MARYVNTAWKDFERLVDQAMLDRAKQYTKDLNIVENAITIAVSEGWMKDVRSDIPTANSRYKVDRFRWPKRLISEVLGQCTHHNASRNDNDPVATANYHTGVNNHITPGKPLPTMVYPICIPKDGIVLLTGNILDRTYAQAYGGLADGDENLHLVAVLVMGGFSAPGYKGYATGPTVKQLEGHTKVCQWLAELFNYGAEGNFYHAHFGKAGCPGYVLMTRIDSWRESAKQDLKTDLDWQQALLRWKPDCLPKYGADGVFGYESKRALIKFQQEKKLYVTGITDPFTELVLLRDYPMPESNTTGDTLVPT